MKVILLQDVPGTGKKMDVKDVSDGHALNMLFPRRLAREATAGALKQVEVEKVRIAAEHKIQEDLLLKNLSEVEGKMVHISSKANEQGHLFAAIHKDEIARRLLEELRVSVKPDFIDLPEPIKSVGDHVVSIAVAGKNAKLTVSVEALK